MISVIITNYKHHQYLMQAVQSILQQTYQAGEIIIVNDDPDVDLDTYRLIDNRIKVIQNPENMGQVYSINIGTKIATGDYIAYQDADDWSVPHRLEIELRHIEWEGRDVVYSDCITVKSTGDYYTKAPEASLDTLKKQSIGVWGSVMVVAEFAKETPYVFRGYGNDRIWWIDVMHKTDEIGYIPLPLYYYRWHTGNYRKFTNIPILRKLHRLKIKRRLDEFAKDRFRYWENINKKK